MPQHVKKKNDRAEEDVLVLHIVQSVTLDEAATNIVDMGCEVTSHLVALHALIIVIPPGGVAHEWAAQLEQQDWVQSALYNEVIGCIE